MVRCNLSNGLLATLSRDLTPIANAECPSGNVILFISCVVYIAQLSQRGDRDVARRRVQHCNFHTSIPSQLLYPPGRVTRMFLPHKQLSFISHEAFRGCMNSLPAWLGVGNNIGISTSDAKCFAGLHGSIGNSGGCSHVQTGMAGMSRSADAPVRFLVVTETAFTVGNPLRSEYPAVVEGVLIRQEGCSGPFFHLLLYQRYLAKCCLV